MSFTLRAYKDIMEGTKKIDETRNEDGFEDTRATLRGEHHAASVDELDQPRRHQVQFIDKAKEVLHSSGKQESAKARIMTGLMLLERAIIAKSYGENIFDITQNDLTKDTKSKSHRRSTYYRCLGINIGLTPENPLELEDYLELLYKARSFIGSQVYKNGLSKDGFKRDHPFAKIAELKISDYMNMCTSLIAEAEYRVIARNESILAEELRKEAEAEELRKREEAQKQAEEEARKKTTTSTPWFGGFAIWSNPTPDQSIMDKRTEEKAGEKDLPKEEVVADGLQFH